MLSDKPGLLEALDEPSYLVRHFLEFQNEIARMCHDILCLVCKLLITHQRAGKARAFIDTLRD